MIGNQGYWLKSLKIAQIQFVNTLFPLLHLVMAFSRRCGTLMGNEVWAGTRSVPDFVVGPTEIDSVVP